MASHRGSPVSMAPDPNMSRMGTVTVITGSPGTGKTTVGKLLAERLSDGVHMETDLFYRCFTRPVAPHLPEADRQNQAAIASCCQAAKALVLRGYNVVLEGILGPWFAPLVQQAFGPEVTDVRYVILRASLEEAKRRVRQRGHSGMDHVVEAMHPQFENLGAWEASVLACSHVSATQIVQAIQDGLAQGRFSIGVAAQVRSA